MRNKQKWQKMMLLSLVFVFVIVVNACSSGTNGPAGSSTPSASPSTSEVSSTPSPAVEPVKKDLGTEPIKLKLLTGLPPDSAYKQISDEFTKKFPNVTVEWIWVNEGQPTVDALTQAIAANDPIDVFWQNTMSGIVNGGFAEELTPYIESDKEFQSYPFSPEILAPFNWNGKQWAVSRGNDVFLVAYNKDLLNKFGLEMPQGDDWTWEKMREMAIAATKPEENLYGMGDVGIWLRFAAPMIPAANGHAPRGMLMNEDYSASVGDNPDVLDDLQWMYDMMAKDEIMLSPKQKEAKGLKDVDLWANGNSLFMFHVSPVFVIWKNNFKFNWDIAPLPKGTAKAANLSFNNPMFMSKASKNKDAAWEFMKFWVATMEGQKILIDVGGTFPNSQSPEIVDYFKGTNVYDGWDRDALLAASSTAEINAPIPMLGGDLLDTMLTTWAFDKAPNEMIGPHDFFPAEVEKLNKELKAQKEKYNP